MRLLITISFLFSFAFAQRPVLNIKDFGATGRGVVDEWPVLQKVADSAVKVNAIVRIPAGRYRIDKPLLFHRQINGRWVFFTVDIIGDDVLFSSGTGITQIIPTFKAGFAIGIQAGKGCTIRGLTFNGMWKHVSKPENFAVPYEKWGDTTCSDQRTAPYVAIAIDPVGPKKPTTGIYKEWEHLYSGLMSVTGSSSTTIDNCNIYNFTGAIVFSPNGYTLNNEGNTISNIKSTNCKFFFAGCQAQEKTNRIENVYLWGGFHTLFRFNTYGQGHPGDYDISRVNAAGFNIQLIHRASQGFFPLFMDRIYCESLAQIGYWDTQLNDAISNSSINLNYYKHQKAFPDNHFTGGGISMNNVNIRYYVFPPVPMLIKGSGLKLTNSNGLNGANHIRGRRHYYTDTEMNNGYTITRIAHGNFPFVIESGIKKVTLTQRLAEVKKGDYVVFYSYSNNDFAGMGEVETVTDKYYTISYCSPGLDSTQRLNVGVYKSK